MYKHFYLLWISKQWPEFATAMAKANGACPYGAYSKLIKNEIPSDCRVYRWKPENSVSENYDSEDELEEEEEDPDDSDYR